MNWLTRDTMSGAWNPNDEGFLTRTRVHGSIQAGSHWDTRDTREEISARTPYWGWVGLGGAGVAAEGPEGPTGRSGASQVDLT